MSASPQKPAADRERRFVDEYLVDFDAARSAVAAGYSERRAKQAGHELLKRERVQELLRVRRADLQRRTEVTQERVIEELRRIAFADIRDLFVWSEERAAYIPSTNLTEEQAAAIQAVEAETTYFTREDGTEEKRVRLKLRTWSKPDALEKIMRHLGMYVERHEVSGPGGAPIEFRDMTDAELVERARSQANRIAAEVAQATAPTNGNGRRNGHR